MDNFFTRAARRSASYIAIIFIQLAKALNHTNIVSAASKVKNSGSKIAAVFLSIVRCVRLSMPAIRAMGSGIVSAAAFVILSCFNVKNFVLLGHFVRGYILPSFALVPPAFLASMWATALFYAWLSFAGVFMIVVAMILAPMVAYLIFRKIATDWLQRWN